MAIRNVGVHADLGELIPEEAPMLENLPQALLAYISSAPLLLSRAEEHVKRLKKKDRLRLNFRSPTLTVPYGCLILSLTAITNCDAEVIFCEPSSAGTAAAKTIPYAFEEGDFGSARSRFQAYQFRQVVVWKRGTLRGLLSCILTHRVS